MLGFIKNWLKKKCWNQEQKLLEYDWIEHNHLMQQYIKDAYDKAKSGDEVKLWIYGRARSLCRDIEKCREYKKLEYARLCLLQRLQWLEEIDKRFNLNYYRNGRYEDLFYVLLKDLRKEQKESKKMDIIAAKSDYFV